MDFLQIAINFVSSVPWYWVLLFALFVTFLENVFPPAPSDTIIVFMGGLVSIGKLDFVSLLLFSTIGSVIGFYVMFVVGEKFEHKIIESDKFSFISRAGINKVEGWFQKWGYWMIVANRFLSGTRAIISFFAGMSELKLKRTLILSGLSALVWNSVLIYLGYIFGEQWHLVDQYMVKYGKFAMAVFGVIALIFLIKWIYTKFFQKKNEIV